MRNNRCDNGEDLNSSGQPIGKTHRTRDLELLTVGRQIIFSAQS